MPLTEADNSLPPKKKKQNSALTYFIVLLLLMVLLVLAFPNQFVQLITAVIAIFENITAVGQIIIVAAIIGLIVYLLKRAEKI